MRNFWNLLEEGTLGALSELIMPYIAFNSHVYLPSHPILTHESVLQAIQDGTWATISGEVSRPQIEPCSASTRGRIALRMLSRGSLDDQKPMTTVVIHTPGGGFIATSSYSHQFYTRRWANELNAVVFSLDYHKAPEYPYPYALDELFQAYLWIVGQGWQHYNYRPERVILAGDSAGGNLSAALTALCVKYRQRVPDHLLLYYPAMNVSFKAYLPSVLTAMRDKFLNHDMLRLCVESYCQSGHSGETDPFVSPNLLPDALLAGFPQTRIFVGSKDALVDQSKYFTVRLRKLGKDVRLKVYEGLPHAFMNFDVPLGLKESRVCVADSLATLARFMGR